jgi:hypothetical protein
MDRPAPGRKHEFDSGARSARKDDGILEICGEILFSLAMRFVLQFERYAPRIP